MYKVFINGKSLILTDNYDDYTSDYDSLFITHSDTQTLKTTVDLLAESPVLSSIYIHHNDLEELWAAFISHYVLIETAGGVVQNNDRVLFISKNQHWDLPKGKMEKNETHEDCALREVKEECGLSNLNLEGKLGKTYHVYEENGAQILKKTTWFKMTSDEEGPFQGDSKEGISEVKWMNASEWEASKEKSYPSIIDLLSSVF